MRLPLPTVAYNARHERERNRTLEQADNLNRKTTDDVELGDEKLILTSPNGTRYSVTVDNAGTLSTTAL